MRNFTNPKAIELYIQAQELEKEAEELITRGSILADKYGELMTTSAGLRVLADDIEDGIISEEELEGAWKRVF